MDVLGRIEHSTGDRFIDVKVAQWQMKPTKTLPTVEIAPMNSYERMGGKLQTDRMRRTHFTPILILLY